MSKEKWLAAAHKYRAKQQAQQSEPQPAPATAVATARVPGTSVSEIVDALNSFLHSSEGAAAIALLRASHEFVRLAEGYEGGGSGFVIFLDGDGLKESIEAMGLWRVYAKREDIPNPKEKLMNVREAAQAVVEATEGKATAEKLLFNLRTELDLLAERAGQ
jgi:hypothetical protein